MLSDFPMGEFPALPPAVIQELHRHHDQALMRQLMDADVSLRMSSWFPQN